MKKLIKISLLVALVLMLALGVLQSASALTLPGGGPQPNVGWNTKPTSAIDAAPVLAGLILIKPNVGWNT